MARKMKTQKRRKYKRGGGVFDGEMFKSKPGRTYSQYFGFTEETPTLAQSVGLQPPPQTLQSSVGLNGGQLRRHASSRAGSKRRSRKTRRTRKIRKGGKK